MTDHELRTIFVVKAFENFLRIKVQSVGLNHLRKKILKILEQDKARLFVMAQFDRVLNLQVQNVLSKLWNCKEGLDQRVEIAGVANIFY